MEIAVRVTPRASRERVTYEGDKLKVFVTAAPVDGQANAAVQQALSKALRIPKSRIAIIRGETSRDKLVRLDDLTEEQLRNVLSAESP